MSSPFGMKGLLVEVFFLIKVMPFIWVYFVEHPFKSIERVYDKYTFSAVYLCELSFDRHWLYG